MTPTANPAQLLGLAFLLAFLVESFIEYLLGTPLNKIPRLAPYKWALMYAAMLTGVGLALYYQLDIVALISGQPHSVVGQVLTGMVVGRGSNFLHQFGTKYLPSPLASLLQPFTKSAAVTPTVRR
jgi:hypothetical protein